MYENPPKSFILFGGFCVYILFSRRLFIRMAGTAGLIAAVNGIFESVEDDQIVVLNLSTVFTIESMVFFAVLIADITALRHIGCMQYVAVGCGIIDTWYITGAGCIIVVNGDIVGGWRSINR